MEAKFKEVGATVEINNQQHIKKASVADRSFFHFHEADFSLK
jgi:hypothetical protein